MTDAAQTVKSTHKLLGFVEAIEDLERQRVEVLAPIDLSIKYQYALAKAAGFPKDRIKKLMKFRADPTQAAEDDETDRIMRHGIAEAERERRAVHACQTEAAAATTAGAPQPATSSPQPEPTADVQSSHQ